MVLHTILAQNKVKGSPRYDNLNTTRTKQVLVEKRQVGYRRLDARQKFLERLEIKERIGKRWSSRQTLVC